MIKNPVAIFKDYQLKNLKDDFYAGLAVSILAFPQNMAYALIAGVNPVYGLYSSIVGMISATFLGVSNYMVVGPCNMIVLAIYSNLNSSGMINDSNYLTAVFVLTFLVGVIQVILASLKLGNLVSYISQSVIIGLTTAVALIIGAGQLSNLLGIDISSGANIFETVHLVGLNLGQANLYALFLGALTMVLIIAIKKSDLKLPAYIIGIITATMIVYLFNLAEQVPVVEGFSATLPSFNLIEFDLELFGALLNSALSIAILGFIQVVSIVKYMEKKSGQEVDINEEFISQGLINIICSFFSSFVITGSFTKSFANYAAGAKTRVSQLITGLLFIAFILVFAPLIQYIPIASLAGLVIVVASSMIDLAEIKKSLFTTQFDSIVFSTTFIMTLASPRLDYAIYFGIAVSVLLILRDNSKVDCTYISYNERKKEFSRRDLNQVKEDQYIVINLSGELHFNTSKDLKDKLEQSLIKDKDFVLRLEEVQTIDLTTIEELEKFINRVRANGGEVYLAGMRDNIYSALQKYGIINDIGRDHVFAARDNIFSSTEQAIKKVAQTA